MPKRRPTPDLAARYTDSEMRRHGALALLNLGYVIAAREVLAGGYPDWPSLREARVMTVCSTVWWVAFDADTFAWVRDLVTAPESHGALAVGAA